MEIVEKKIVVKLDKEERDTLISAISLMKTMGDELGNLCSNCPFKVACDDRSDTICFFDMVADDLKYINNNCD
jgi:hypothetical protein